MEEKKETACSGNCSSCNKSDCQSRDLKVAPHRLSKVKHVIGVVSGKGGVGKSMVSSLLASCMQKRNKNCAILDADITGPSIPKMFGLKDSLCATDDGMFPNFSKTGIQIMSTNFLLEEETQPVIWRGPVIANLVTQFWSECIWNDVDYMFVDMPPGTGDVPLTVFQSLPVDGIVVVTSPQDLVSMIVEKCVNMAKMLNLPILAIVENMSYFVCPNCKEKHHIFGNSHIEEIAKKDGILTTCKLPMNSEFAKKADNGQIEDLVLSELNPILDILENLKK
ncbi:MAG: Mrp/NBP35 family ATP-binding protein [Clostridia bacterium]|nr:Mrp/NBP35 family ATP-binding protein [Clostridia bacterium]